MPLEEHRIAVAEGAFVTATVALPAAEPCQAAVVLAHGAGTDRTDALLRGLQAGLVDAGHGAVLFNFPYRERGRWPPDRRDVLERAYRDVLAYVAADSRLGHRPLVVGGRSLGGRVATHLAASDRTITGVVCLAFPLHLPKRPGISRAAHFPALRMPVLIVQGTRDPMAEPAPLAEAQALLAAPILHAIVDGDHGFRVLRRTGRTPEAVEGEIVATVVAAVRTWLSGPG